MSLALRLSVEEDTLPLTSWLMQPGVLAYFPMIDLREVEDAVRIWVSYIKQEASLTALWEGKPCGMAMIYIQPYKKLAHQCLLTIVVDEEYRGKGVGTALLKELMRIGKEKFKIEILHLEVYENNLGAIKLYKKLGFKEFGCQKHFIKDQGQYIGKIYMQRIL